MTIVIGETSVAEACADRQYAPTFHVLHKGDLRKPLHHAIVMHHDRCVMFSDLRNGFDETRW